MLYPIQPSYIPANVVALPPSSTTIGPSIASSMPAVTQPAFAQAPSADSQVLNAVGIMADMVNKLFNSFVRLFDHMARFVGGTPTASATSVEQQPAVVQSTAQAAPSLGQQVGGVIDTAANLWSQASSLFSQAFGGLKGAVSTGIEWGLGKLPVIGDLLGKGISKVGGFFGF